MKRQQVKADQITRQADLKVAKATKAEAGNRKLQLLRRDPQEREQAMTCKRKWLLLLEQSPVCKSGEACVKTRATWEHAATCIEEDCQLPG